jgi:hypothetical protein
MRLPVPLRLRISRAMQQALAQAGTNTSAAARAYLLLGVAATGEDISTFRGELAGLLGEELSPSLLTALEQCRAGAQAVTGSAVRETDGIHLSPSLPTQPLVVAEPVQASVAPMGAWDDAYEV